jgi:hypothetical protein
MSDIVKLRKIMRKRGYGVSKVPYGKGLLMTRYYKDKIPYSTVISEDELLEIIMNFMEM